MGTPRSVEVTPGVQKILTIRVYEEMRVTVVFGFPPYTAYRSKLKLPVTAMIPLYSFTCHGRQKVAWGACRYAAVAKTVIKNGSVEIEQYLDTKPTVRSFDFPTECIKSEISVL